MGKYSRKDDIHFENKSFQLGSKYARGLVVLNLINMDRIVHL